MSKQKRSRNVRRKSRRVRRSSSSLVSVHNHGLPWTRRSEKCGLIRYLAPRVGFEPTTCGLTGAVFD
jgi:hypothetical protein